MNQQPRTINANLVKIGSITAGLLLWHGLAVYAINDPSLLVSPIVVARTAYEMLFVTGELYPHLWASSWIFFYGFVLSILAGVPLSFLMALSPRVRDYVNPWMATSLYDPTHRFRPGSAALVRHRRRF